MRAWRVLLPTLAVAVRPRASADEAPQRGGTLVFGLSAAPPSYDRHQSDSYATIDTVADLRGARRQAC